MHDSAEDDERTRRLKRIRQVSGIMKWLVTGVVGLIALVAALVMAMFVSPELIGLTADSNSEFAGIWREIGQETIDMGEAERPIGDIPFYQRIGLAVLLMGAIGTLMIALWQIRQLFDRFRQTDFFSAAALSRMLALGWWLVAFGVYDIVSDPIGSVLLTLDYPEGQKEVAIEIEGAEIFFMIFGTIMILFGWIMREAASIAEENKQFI